MSKRLQDQISFLCNEVYDDEWSGTLFYTVEGELGEENFKILADYVYLQDIGTSTYTEYDPGNPTFIKFLVDNPSFLEMKQGHIHSHNKMDVFFSGTDNDELKENSAFHNYYVSLIVNNKNEMCAKVAFRATEKRQTKSVVSFRGTNGDFLTKEATGETTEESVYTYGCTIDKPDSVGESFTTRFHCLLEERQKKAEEDRKKMAAKAKEISKAIDPLSGWDGKKSYEQVKLYDDIIPEGGRRKSKKEDKRQGRHGIHGSVTLPPDYRSRETWSGSVGGGPSKKGVADTGKGEEIDGRRVYDFLVKLLRRDFIADGRLSDVLEKLHNDLYNPKFTRDEGDQELYMDSLDDLAYPMYIDSFPEDQHVVNFNKVMSKGIDLLEMYGSDYPEVVLDLVQALNYAMDEE